MYMRKQFCFVKIRNEAAFYIWVLTNTVRYDYMNI